MDRIQEIYERTILESPALFKRKDIINALDVLDFLANELKGKGNELDIKVYGTPAREQGGSLKIDGKKMSKAQATDFLSKYI